MGQGPGSSTTGPTMVAWTMRRLDLEIAMAFISVVVEWITYAFEDGDSMRCPLNLWIGFDPAMSSYVCCHQVLQTTFHSDASSHVYTVSLAEAPSHACCCRAKGVVTVTEVALYGMS
jgi:hypothetical protein